MSLLDKNLVFALSVISSLQFVLALEKDCEQKVTLVSFADLNFLKLFSGLVSKCKLGIQGVSRTIRGLYNQD